jgi:hypothetical protein
MNETVDGRFDDTVLTPVVRRALGREAAEVIDWHVEPVHGGVGGGDIHRISGSARARSDTLTWSVIHKVVRAAADSQEPHTLRYWAREPLAYGSGALADLPGGLVAPQCFGLEQTSEGEYTLWLEDIRESTQRWTLDHYAAAARQLGRFNAAYLTDAPLPTWPWLCRDFLRAWIVGTHAGPNVAAVRDFPDDPRVRRWFPGDMREALLRLWEERDGFLGALAGQPQTLCHMDAFRRNLLIRRMPTGGEQLVFLDWAFMGTGALGEELAPLVAATVALFGIGVDEIEALDDIAFRGYLAGLADAGWRGDPRQIRLAYAVASSMRFGLPVVIDLLDGDSDPWMEGVFGRRIDEIVPRWIDLRRFLFRLADEARALIHDVG